MSVLLRPNDFISPDDFADWACNQYGELFSGPVNDPETVSIEVYRAGLKSLIRTAYRTSFETEEGRASECGILLTAADDAVPVNVPFAATLSAGTLAVFSQMVLDSRDVIVVTLSDSGDLVVAGLARLSIHDIYYEHRRIQPLVRILGPGRLRLNIASLSDEYCGGNAEIFAKLYSVCCVRSWIHRIAQAQRNAGEYPGRAPIFYRVLADCLLQMRDRRHGGTLLVVPAGFDSNRAAAHLTVGYPCETSVVRHAIDRLAACTRPASQVRSGGQPSEQDLLAAQAEADLLTTIEHVVGMSMIDGAVLMDEQFTLLGFGCIIKRSDTSLRRPRRLYPDGKTGFVEIEQDATDLGTRHRSASCFCREVPGAMAFVVSQDGYVSVATGTDEAVEIYHRISPEDDTNEYPVA
ncbi:hypothetical protein Mal4_25530 [Maioricimonas rarisocia]|uniref:DAC domain-containing protein n=1 Tax=Maioricimonas rarisocia TaxID=2528026 RepID=A0A517Z6W5_9PLAN|nr:diadenylate cyclase [Maioricimonas rarisocia]QDU38228.1 hypothetical protein Mal4_25530 [Maioricimonas rarisocia]